MRRLGSDQFEIREAAQHELDALKPGSLPSLQAVCAGESDLEILTRLRPKMLQLVEAREVNPSGLTLHLHDVTLAQIAADALSQQMGVAEIPTPPDITGARAIFNLDADNVAYGEDFAITRPATRDRIARHAGNRDPGTKRPTGRRRRSWRRVGVCGCEIGIHVRCEREHLEGGRNHHSAGS